MTATQKAGDVATRRGFIAAAGAALVALVTFRKASRAAARSAQSRTVDATRVMYEDLQRALDRPLEQRAWGMVLDTRKCIGCNACVIACMAEHRLPPGVMYRRVPDIEIGSFPDVQRIFMPTNCVQCENPPCRDAAPEGAIRKRPDGIVEFDYASLNDPAVARAVAEACPYQAVSIDEGKTWTESTPASPQPYETLDAIDYGHVSTGARGGVPTGAPRKCDFCLHRLESGQLPACVTTCVGRATYFGDLNDPDSMVSRLTRTEPGLRIMAEIGTGPRITHLAADPAVCRDCH